MELDFSRLSNLSLAGSGAEEAEEPAPGPAVDLSVLQRKSDANKAEREDCRRICESYQNSIKISSQLQTEILKGLKTGEDIYSLFLKAAQAIGLMTGNEVFYRQAEADMRAVYGRGLQYRQPLQNELQSTQERLQRLLRAEQEEQPPDSLERIRAAIKAHRVAIEQLEGMISESGEHQ